MSALVLLLLSILGSDDLLDQVEHHDAKNGDVRIHYVTLGDPEAPLIVLLHGFPDYWYTWREQMPALAEEYRVAAMDLRGYDRSDAPDGVDAYAMRHLIGDVAAVIAAEGRKSAIVIGHDWGAAIAWQVAMWRPDLVERLVILNVPHPNGLSRELAENDEQRENSQYASDFQKEGAHEKQIGRAS
ncbi:MAG: alpha/beta hydrolase, partial [Planctomycetota bacterium]